MASIALGIVLVVVLIGIVGWLVVRARQPAPPPNANEGYPDAMWDSDGAVQKDPDGMPMQPPGDGPSQNPAIKDQADRESADGPGPHA
jgi:hypothetical protein